jgi:lipoyl(octanoyl) transferase
MPRTCEFRDLGRMGYEEAFALQRELVSARKAETIPDQLLFVEHPHVLTLGRNAKVEHVLAAPELLARAGIHIAETDRGGDVTYHGPGQLVGYPIFDLKHWHRDVGAYLRALEEVLIDALATFGLQGERDPEATGVWVGGAKVAAIGIHMSRWVTSHGFALNVDTNLDYFRYIVPCGLTKPVASLRSLGVTASTDEVKRAVRSALEEVFDLKLETKAAHLAQLTEQQ